MRSLRLAWLIVIRQPGRTALGVLGVAAVGALLFDMLLLSNGLVLSFSELLDRTGFDVRVLASDAPPFTGPRLAHASAIAGRLSALPEVETVMQLRVEDAEILSDSTLEKNGSLDRRPSDDPRGPQRGGWRVAFVGADRQVRSLWTIVEGRDLRDESASTSTLIINRNLARSLRVSTGSTLTLRGRCERDSSAAYPAVTFTVIGIADFPFDSTAAGTVAGTLTDVRRLCGAEGEDQAEMLVVRSRPHAGADAAAAAIRAAQPGLHVVTNDDLVEQFRRVEFSYFRQISVVLATVTLFFGFLLIAVLLTVSVNQRLGEIAALRALGLSRQRVVSGVLWESMLFVGAGGLLAIPLGAALSMWLDSILRAMPGVPADLHFFVFEPRALVMYALLLVVTSLAAAAYPMRIVAVLPIAATLRREVVS